MPRRGKTLTTAGLSVSLLVWATLAVVWPQRLEAAGWLDAAWRAVSAGLTASGEPARSPLEEAGDYLRAQPPLPPPVNAIALAAHLGDGGHWTFLNRRGETHTAGTADEMKRLAAALAPEVTEPRARLVLHLTRASLSADRTAIGALPAGAELRVLIQGESHLLVRRRTATGESLSVALRPRLHLDLGRVDFVDDMLAQLARRLERPRLRVLALEPGGPQTLPREARVDAGSQLPPIEAIDPLRLPAALASVRGQTALVSARVAGRHLAYRPKAGGELTIPLAELTTAAAAAGADLLILQSVTPHQPGTRNWLWQRFEIEGLAKALAAGSLADLIEAVMAARGAVLVRPEPADGGRMILRIGPAEDGGDGKDGLGGMLKEVTAGITGTISSSRLDAYLTGMSERRELARRLVPFVPSSLQGGFLVCLALGIAGLATARRWWRYLWPPEQPADYAGRLGFIAASAIRLLLFVGLFLPVAGPPALVATLVRGAGRLLGRTRAVAGPSP